MIDRFSSWVSRVRVPVVGGRPLAVRPTVSAWLVMIIALYWGYESYDRNFQPDWVALSWNPGSNHGANFRSYRHAAELALDSQQFYDVAPPGLDDWAVFLYPPITTVVYYPFTLLEWMTGYLILGGMNVLAGFVAAVVIVRFIERKMGSLGWVDVGLMTALFTLSPFSFGTMYYGNINILLALALIIGFVAMEDDRETMAGIAFGLAALWKVFPALIGIWLLWRRSWRAIATAIGIGGGGLIAGLIVYGWETTHYYFVEVLFGRTDTLRFVGGYPADGTYYITLQRPLSHLIWFGWPGAPAELLLPATLVVAVALIAPFYYRLDDHFDVLIAIFATVIITVTVIPALQWYIVLLFFPMLPLLYLWNGPGRIPFVLGAIVLFFNARPGNIVETIEEIDLPNFMSVVLTWLFSVATVQLYAIVLMLGACAYWKYSARLSVNWHVVNR